MALRSRIHSLFASLWSIFVEVVFFWQLRLLRWTRRISPHDALLETLNDARYFEEYEAASFQLDALLGNDLWRQNPTSKYYDYRLIYGRLQAIITAREDADILTLVNLLRSGLVRNLGNITTPRLFTRAYAGTKLLIEDYVTQVALAIDHVTAYPSSAEGLTSQAKLDLLHDTRQAFGRSALVLQGGAIFGLCHIGVVKALHLRGLLPRIIAGTSTGALIAALVGVHTEDELLDFLTGEKIDLSAFAGRLSHPSQQQGVDPEYHSWMSTLIRRVKRFLKQGYFLDVKVLEECVRANVGNLTFEEAYQKTKRVLNITIPADPGAGVPSLLNYLTAPNVVCIHGHLLIEAALTGIVDMVCSCSLECLVVNSSLLSRHDLLQRSEWSDTSLVQRQHRNSTFFPYQYSPVEAASTSTDTPCTSTQHRSSSIASVSCGRAVQRESLCCISGTAVYCPMAPEW